MEMRNIFKKRHSADKTGGSVDSTGRRRSSSDDAASTPRRGSGSRSGSVDENGVVVLKPGSRIRPVVSEEDVRKLAERLYGIIVQEMCELNSYDDRNFLIHDDKLIKNPIIKEVCEAGYVLKIANSLDSKDEAFFEAQTELMLHLKAQHICCPTPVHNIHGKYQSLEKIGDEMHVVRLLEYIPGKVFHGVPHPDRLFYEAGSFIAQIDTALKGMKHEGLLRRQSIWMLDNIPQLKEFVYVVKDEHRRDIVEQVLESYDKHVLPILDKLEKGVIYGDFNEYNIIVSRKEDHPKEYEITGIIDFGDVSYSKYIFELAIAMAYMMLESNELDTGGLIMAGYSMIRVIPPHEKHILQVSIASRLVQSLVLGLYTSTVDETNQYILSSQTRGWNLLEALWKENDEEILERWENIANQYLTRSEE